MNTHSHPSGALKRLFSSLDYDRVNAFCFLSCNCTHFFKKIKIKMSFQKKKKYQFAVAKNPLNSHMRLLYLVLLRVLCSSVIDNSSESSFTGSLPSLFFQSMPCVCLFLLWLRWEVCRTQFPAHQLNTCPLTRTYTDHITHPD